MPDSRTRRFESLILPHVEAGFGLARRLMGKREDGEDAVQEALLRAFRHFDRCQEATARPWFLRILRNVCFDTLTARGMARQVGFADYDPLDPDGAAFEADIFQRASPDPEAALAAKDQGEKLEAAFAALPLLFREVVILRHVEEMSYSEIAAIAGVPPGTVMSRLSRGRDLLMKALGDQNG